MNQAGYLASVNFIERSTNLPLRIELAEIREKSGGLYSSPQAAKVQHPTDLAAGYAQRKRTGTGNRSMEYLKFERAQVRRSK